MVARCLVWPCGLEKLRYATLQNLIPSFPWIASLRPPPQSKERKGSNFAIWQQCLSLTCSPHIFGTKVLKLLTLAFLSLGVPWKTARAERRAPSPECSTCTHTSRSCSIRSDRDLGGHTCNDGEQGCSICMRRRMRHHQGPQYGTQGKCCGCVHPIGKQ